MKKQILVSILNWNNAPDTIACINSLREVSDTSFFDICIVDNASIDDSFNLIKEKTNERFYIQSKQNNGYAAGHSLSLEIALKEKYQYFWILNNDLVVKKDTLINLLKEVEKFPNSIFGSVTLKSENPDIIGFGGGLSDEISKPLDYNAFENTLLLEYQNKYSTHSVQSLEGSSLLIPLAVINKYGFMSLDFFMYGEETDYCYRLAKVGVKSLIVPTSVVLHKNEGSTNQYPNLKYIIAYYRRRNFLRFSIDHTGRTRWSAFNVQDGVVNNCKSIVKGLLFKKNIDYYYALASIHAGLGIKGKVVSPDKILKKCHSFQ